MVRTRANGDDVLDVPEGSIAHSHGHGQPSHGNAPSSPPRPPFSLKQLLATQNELMALLIQNETHHGAKQPQHPRCQDMNTSYSEFLSTHSPLFFGQRTRSRQMIGSAPPNQSLVCFTVQSTRRLCMQLSSSEAQQGPSRHHTPPRCQQNTMCPGVSSAPLFMATTCQLAQCVANLQSCWICTMGSTTWHNMGGHHVDTDAKKVELFRKGLTI
jgi:hypothetical protein